MQIKIAICFFYAEKNGFFFCEKILNISVIKLNPYCATGRVANWDNVQTIACHERIFTVRKKSFIDSHTLKKSVYILTFRMFIHGGICINSATPHSTAWSVESFR